MNHSRDNEYEPENRQQAPRPGPKTTNVGGMSFGGMPQFMSKKSEPIAGQ